MVYLCLFTLFISLLKYIHDTQHSITFKNFKFPSDRLFTKKLQVALLQFFRLQMCIWFNEFYVHIMEKNKAENVISRKLFNN